jgi:hypothetical protein
VALFAGAGIAHDYVVSPWLGSLRVIVVSGSAFLGALDKMEEVLV